jgi:dephospho-CoA kinase
MLRVGLTGGIGSGKSTVAQRFRELGAVVIDADELARDVVALGSAGLAAIRERFGAAVIARDGSLDRGALGRIVFADPKARKALEAITHPLISARTRSLMESASPEQIVVHEVPLLVELDMAAAYHLTVVVGTDNDHRMARLTGGRGLTQADVRARIAAQAGDRERRAVADEWLDNNGTVDELVVQVDALWRDRIVGFNDNLVSGSVSGQPESPALCAYVDSWPETAARLIRRVAQALGEQAMAIEHVGATSVPGLPARDVIDLQVGVRALAEADEAGFVRALAESGFPRLRADEPLHGNSDPGRVVRVRVCEVDGGGWRQALLFRDWLRAVADERDAYGALKRDLAESAGTTLEYVEARQPWLAKAAGRAEAWAASTGWTAQTR